MRFVHSNSTLTVEKIDLFFAVDEEPALFDILLAVLSIGDTGLE